jgi:hypothetical protein
VAVPLMGASDEPSIGRFSARPVDMRDLESIDPEYHKYLQGMFQLPVSVT